MTDPQVTPTRAPVHAFTGHPDRQVEIRAAVIKAAAECCCAYEVMSDGEKDSAYTFSLRCRRRRHQSVLAAMLRVKHLVASWENDPYVRPEVVRELQEAMRPQ